MAQAPSIEEFAGSCVAFVQKAVGVALDFTPDTLPVLDHYLRQAHELTSDRPESIPLLTAAAGAYLGELIRKRHGCHWNLDDDDPMGWYLEFDDDLMLVYPVAIAHVAMAGEDADADVDVIRFKDDERDLVIAHLADLPPVSSEEYVAASTRVEVVDIAVDLIRAHRQQQEQEPPLPSDLD